MGRILRLDMQSAMHFILTNTSQNTELYLEYMHNFILSHAAFENTLYKQPPVYFQILKY